MKPPPFDYADPDTIEELLALLAEAGDDAAIIAGGQSLIPLLNLRLARPDLVIDPRRIVELASFEIGQSGMRAGAMACALDVEEHPQATLVPGLQDALGHIGHAQIRSRTTIGGSIAHADPAAELPALLIALEGEVTLRSADRGERVVRADEFFLGPLTTAREPDEIITSAWFPAHAGRLSVTEVAKRPGDFAMVGAVVGFALVDGVIADPRISIFGVGGRAMRARGAEAELAGAPPAHDVYRAAADNIRANLETTDDTHASGDYRRHVAATLVERKLASLS